MLDVLTDPRGFFRARSGSAGWLYPSLIVSVVALIGVAGTFLGGQQLTGQFGALAGAFQAISAIVGFVTAFVVWALYAGIFYAISAVFDGEGSFGELMKFVGWGYLPAIVSSAFSTVASAIVLQNTEVPTNDPQAAFEASQAIQSSPLIVASTVVGIVVTLYQGFIWSYAVQVARDLDRRQALITVGIPVGFSVLLSLPGLLGAF